jgi:hypothetical protein
MTRVADMEKYRYMGHHAVGERRRAGGEAGGET